MEQYRVTYARRDELQRDFETQIARGGLYARLAERQALEAELEAM